MPDYEEDYGGKFERRRRDLQNSIQKRKRDENIRSWLRVLLLPSMGLILYGAYRSIGQGELHMPWLVGTVVFAIGYFAAMVNYEELK